MCYGMAVPLRSLVAVSAILWLGTFGKHGFERRRLRTPTLRIKMIFRCLLVGGKTARQGAFLFLYICYIGTNFLFAFAYLVCRFRWATSAELVLRQVLLAEFMGPRVISVLELFFLDCACF